jgi:hypothetical protein
VAATPLLLPRVPAFLHLLPTALHGVIPPAPPPTHPPTHPPTCFDVLRPRDQRQHKPAAGGGQVKAHRLLGANGRLHLRVCGG